MPIFAVIFSRTVVEVSSKQFVATATIFRFLAVCELKVLSCETECDSCESSYLSLHRQHRKLRQSAKWRDTDTRGRQLTWINHIDLGFASLCSAPSLSHSLFHTHARVWMYTIVMFCPQISLIDINFVLCSPQYAYEPRNPVKYSSIVTLGQ